MAEVMTVLGPVAADRLDVMDNPRRALTGSS
jgi:hypothetical protein